MTIMPEWHKHLCEAVGWIQTRYHHIGRKTGAPFLAVVYPPDIEQEVFREWDAQIKSLNSEFMVRELDLLQITRAATNDIGLDTVLETLEDPAPGCNPEQELANLWLTKIAEEKIDPVIKVGERQNDQKLAAEIGNFVVTPALEQLLEEVLEHYTDTILSATDETGVWISGYFGSGKSHLAKIISLLIENRTLEGIPATERFKSQVPPSSQRHDALIRHLSRISQCNTNVLAFNLNTLIGSKDTPLPLVLLNQYYISKGYNSNHIFAKVIESLWASKRS